MKYKFDYFVVKKDEQVVLNISTIQVGMSLLEQIGRPENVIVGFDGDNGVVGISVAPENTEAPIYKLQYRTKEMAIINCSRISKQLIKLKLFTQAKFPLCRPGRIETLDNEKYIIVNVKEDK